MSVEDRKLEVLRAIVEDFIATNEPVGSKALVERHNLGVSPATIRNDMAALEEEGLIAQPHTSAGRVPTDAGYRLFVDRLTDAQAAVGRRAAGDRRRSSTARSTSTTCCTGRCARSPSSPATSPSCSTRRCRAAGCGTSSSSRLDRPG